MAFGLPFEDFLPFSWKGIHAPLTSLKTSMRHDLAQHRMWKRDGANVESTGRAPLQFHASIPFLKTIAPAKTEQWTDLYPGTWRKFLSESAKGTTGELGHPTLGVIKCKLESFEATLTRGGYDADVTWVQTLTDDDEDKALVYDSPLSTATNYTLDLEVQIADIKQPEFPKYNRTLTDDLREIAGLINSVGLTWSRVFGKIDAVIYRVNNIERSVKYSTNVFHIGITRNTQRIKDAMRTLKQDILNKRRKTVLYFVRKPMTLTNVVFATGDTLADVIELNPSLLSRAIIPANTVVRYYAAA